MRLDEQSFARGVRALCRRDPDLRAVVKNFGPPPMWVRPPGFATLIQIILEQQVSLASARAVYAKLQQGIGRPTPSRFLELDDAQLRACGFSRQKTGYCRGLAEAAVNGNLRLGGLSRLDDDAVRAALVQIKGIGNWTADIYLLMALRRSDVWPLGDLALDNALLEVKRLRKRPTEKRLASITRPWSPWRSVAARVCWHHYLSVRGTTA
jgi:DNA-3-methyladenine glycosylase II